MHQHGADKHTVGTHSVFFYFSPVKICCSYLRVTREVEKQACLPTDGQKEIFIWSPCSGTYSRVLAGLFPPTPGPSHAGGDIISMTFLFAVVVRELGIKDPGEEGEGPSAPQRLLELERETTARTELREERENRCECVKYNVTEGLLRTRGHSGGPLCVGLSTNGCDQRGLAI